MLKSKRTKQTLLFITFTVVIVCAIINYKEIFSWFNWLFAIIFPVIFGFAIAFVLNVPMKLFEKIIFRKSKNKVAIKIKPLLCILLSAILILAIVTLVICLIAPQIGATFELLGKQIPKFIDEAQKWVSGQSETMPDLVRWVQELNIDWDETWKTVMNYVSSGVSGILGNTINIAFSVVNGFVTFILSFIFAINVLLNKAKLKVQFKKICQAYFPEKFNDRFFYICKKSNIIFSKFVAGQCTESLVSGSLTLIGMSILRLPYAPMVAALMSLGALIPMVGAASAITIGVFMIMMVDPIQAIWFIILMTIEQNIEGNIIYPKVVGNSIGLPPMWVLAAVTIGASTYGMVGMLVGVPIASLVYSLLGESVNNRLSKKMRNS